ncbi:hypothetical protein CC85DRAFT_271240 [Cutaneotrichosporon oleaginosum]|uniref:Saccharopine dehydrogenase NADP binding domain-containing protein n=1 Tax=Cutaneotrichosporon oleaginosum TaxID=879819 RepID=A0A0J0XTN2_9TREE|nr:uncharacterized protein CC85DRAFT_271240 [Cutaneotrichosporon oleaginosum]KLT44441.1 hypothetical protein CC85DRAFT_271240 [Cutaneotrichosporon oleaginosum]TXT07839.1 hypothetical protein COLE_04763 [Cutaneotrichosporon oleaginosum]
MPKSHTPTLVVYGATSYTAKHHLLPYLASHPDADSFRLVLSGRNIDKLTAVNDLLPPNAEREIFPLKLNDQGGVEALCKRADVVLNLAGPYQLHNATTLITACIKHGTHYLDLCGEVNFLARIIPNYDFAASKTGSVIIPMCGFEAAPGDLNVYHALRTLQAHAGRQTTIAAATNFYDIAGGVSGGTMASVAASGTSGDHMQGEWCLVPSSWSGRKDPNPSMQLVYRPPVKVAGAPSIGGWYPGSMLNVTTIRRSWFLSRLSPPRHGEDAVFAEAMTNMSPFRVTNVVTAYLYGGILLLFLGLYSSAAWIRDALAAWIPQPGEGPSMESCERGHTRLTTVSRSNDGRYAVITKYAAKGDPGYWHTGKLMAEAGLSLILPPPQGTELPPLARTGGFLTPSTGLGMVLIERMRRNGIATVESEVVELGRPGERKKLL